MILEINMTYLLPVSPLNEGHVRSLVFTPSHFHDFRDG
jgi:hypothetical protein